MIHLLVRIVVLASLTGCIHSQLSSGYDCSKTDPDTIRKTYIECLKNNPAHWYNANTEYACRRSAQALHCAPEEKQTVVN
jgi:hypothetical protein